jgi:hypothetical protein
MLKVVARAGCALVVCLIAARAASAQAVTPPDDEWKITDNSFLVEEAFNQDPHIVQNIFNFQRQTARSWQFTFTQEWPAPSTRHQLSYTIPVQALGGTSGMGDVLINYRLQVLEEGPGRPAFAPRFSVILPSGGAALGAGTHGVQVNLPFSKRDGNWYVHWNAGFTWQRTKDGATLTTPAVAGSIIYRAREMLNLMLEGVVVGVGSTPAQTDPGAPAPGGRIVVTTISPGVRGGWNIGDEKQIVIGAAAPINHSDGETNTSLFLYFSYEGPVKGLPRK